MWVLQAAADRPVSDPPPSLSPQRNEEASHRGGQPQHRRATAGLHRRGWPAACRQDHADPVGVEALCCSTSSTLSSPLTHPHPMSPHSARWSSATPSRMWSRPKAPSPSSRVGQQQLVCVSLAKDSLSTSSPPLQLPPPTSGKNRRLTFFECANDINSMIDIGKVADLVCCGQGKPMPVVLSQLQSLTCHPCPIFHTRRCSCSSTPATALRWRHLSFSMSSRHTAFPRWAILSPSLNCLWAVTETTHSSLRSPGHGRADAP